MGKRTNLDRFKRQQQERQYGMIPKKPQKFFKNARIITLEEMVKLHVIPEFEKEWKQADDDRMADGDPPLTDEEKKEMLLDIEDEFRMNILSIDGYYLRTDGLVEVDLDKNND